MARCNLNVPCSDAKHWLKRCGEMGPAGQRRKHSTTFSLGLLTSLKNLTSSVETMSTQYFTSNFFSHSIDVLDFRSKVTNIIERGFRAANLLGGILKVATT